MKTKITAARGNSIQQFYDEGNIGHANSSSSSVPVAVLTQVEPSVPFPCGQRFPYTGIFSPGGFLSKFQPQHGKNAENIDSNPVVMANTHNKKEKENSIIITNTSSYMCDVHRPLTPICAATEAVNDVPANDKVFAIDHILEQILGDLTTSGDVFNCRLVCHRWKIFATAALQKRVTLSFYNYKLVSNLKTSPSNLLPSLTSLLQESSPAGSFPCNKFTFISHTSHSTMKNIGDETLQEFLNYYGFYIKELSLRFQDKSEYLLSEEATLDKLKLLILHQAPNLRYLSLCLPTKFKIEPKNDHKDFTEEKLSCSKAVIKNSKLRVFKLQNGFEPSAQILEAIAQMAPLEEIIANPCHYAYLLQPTNRLHLPKSLFLNPGHGGLDKFPYEIIASRNDLQLRHLTVNLEKWAEFSPEYKSRVSLVVNQILGSSWNTLKTLRWDGVAFLSGIQLLPPLMPKVWKLLLSNLPNLNNPGGNVLAGDFNLAKRFPHLKCVDLLYLGKDCGGFLKVLSFEPVLTVKTVQVSWTPLLAEHLDRISYLFPRAKVSTYESD